MKRPYSVRLSEVRFVRNGETLQVHDPEPDIPVYNIHVGPELASMTEEEVLDTWNEHLPAMMKRTAGYKHVAIEVPLGSPLVEFHECSGQWPARGDGLRCEINDNEHNMPVIEIDHQEPSWEEFGKLIVTHAGWGMRITFVPDDGIHRQPRVEIREPEGSPEG